MQQIWPVPASMSVINGVHQQREQTTPIQNKALPDFYLTTALAFLYIKYNISQ
jgi:hypothetical protein